MGDLGISVFVFMVAAVVLWLSTSRDARVADRWRRPAGPLLRLAVLIALFHLFFGLAGISVLKGYVVLGLAVVVSLFGLFLDPFLVLFFVTGWLFYEWVFWFPSKKEIILDHSIGGPTNVIDLLGRTGFALTDLHPLGKVEIDGREYEARASFGSIDKGDSIVVDSNGGFEITVRKK